MQFEQPTLHNKDLIKHLTNYMEEWNISPEVLGEDIGTTSVRWWLNGAKPNTESYQKLLDHFDVDFTEKFAYYTPDGHLMFEGTHDTFLLYLDIGHNWYKKLENNGKVIRHTLPTADGDCAEYVAYDVSPESFKANYSRVYEVYKHDKPVFKGNGREVCKYMGITVTRLMERLKMSRDKALQPDGYYVYHIGYDFKKNLEERHESITSA